MKKKEGKMGGAAPGEKERKGEEEMASADSYKRGRRTREGGMG